MWLLELSAYAFSLCVHPVMQLHSFLMNHIPISNHNKAILTTGCTNIYLVSRRLVMALLTANKAESVTNY